jgi:ParB family chromosome partitioning protein
MEIQTIALDRVRTAHRLRPVDADWAALLADRIKEQGLRQPIAVRAADAEGDHQLIFGGHRVAACRMLGWETIPAEVLDVSDLQAELLEVEENLIRAELNPLDRAVFLQRHQVVWEALHPETRHGGKRAKKGAEPSRHDGDLPVAARFTVVAREKFGLSERTVQRAVALARALDGEARALIAGEPLARNAKELEELAKLTPADQRAVVQAMIEHGDTTVQAALRRVRSLPMALPEDPDEAAFRRLAGDWRKASAKARRKFLELLAFEGAVLPEVKR